MVSLDSSIIPAIVVFLLTIVVLNRLLFQPLMRVQAERQSRTTGSMAESRRKLEDSTRKVESFLAAIRGGRMAAYRLQEQVRSEAMKKRADSLEKARGSAEQMMRESQQRISAQVEEAKEQLSREARDLAGGIASAVLRRPA